ncbi:MAG TPA: hypothetical protein VF258_04540, partial [Luteolibacter sp.]
MKPKHSSLFLASCIAPIFCALSAPLAQAATYYWDNDGTTAGFGTATGTWAAPTTGSASQGWSTDGTGGTLPGSVTTATTDITNFGNGATGLASGTITVSGAVSSGNMTFASGSGAITLSGGTSITLGGGATITVNNAAATINTNILGSGGLIKAGTGTLTHAYTFGSGYTGATTVNDGTMVAVFSGAAQGNASSGWGVNNTSVLRFDVSAMNGGSSNLALSGVVAIASGAKVELYTDSVIHNTSGNTLIFSGASTGFSGSGALNKEGTGFITINNGNALANFTGTMNINAGTLAFQGGTTTS